MGSDRLMLEYLAKRLNFNFTTIQPPRAFSGLMDMVSDGVTVIVILLTIRYLLHDRLQAMIWTWVPHKQVTCMPVFNVLTIFTQLRATTLSWEKEMSCKELFN